MVLRSVAGNKLQRDRDSDSSPDLPLTPAAGGPGYRSARRAQFISNLSEGYCSLKTRSILSATIEFAPSSWFIQSRVK